MAIVEAVHLEMVGGYHNKCYRIYSISGGPTGGLLTVCQYGPRGKAVHFVIKPGYDFAKAQERAKLRKGYRQVGARMRFNLHPTIAAQLSPSLPVPYSAGQILSDTFDCTLETRYDIGALFEPLPTGGREEVVVLDANPSDAKAWAWLAKVLDRIDSFPHFHGDSGRLAAVVPTKVADILVGLPRIRVDRAGASAAEDTLSTLELLVALYTPDAPENDTADPAVALDTARMLA